MFLNEMLSLTVEEKESWAFMEFLLAMIDFVSVSSGPNPSPWCHLRSWLRVENQLLTTFLVLTFLSLLWAFSPLCKEAFVFRHVS